MKEPPNDDIYSIYNKSELKVNKREHDNDLEQIDENEILPQIQNVEDRTTASSGNKNNTYRSVIGRSEMFDILNPSLKRKELNDKYTNFNKKLLHHDIV